MFKKDSADQKMTSPEQISPAAVVPAKRPRPVISCLECRRKKLKCSRTYPCAQCVKIGRPGRCEFQAGQEPEANEDWAGPSSAPIKKRRVQSPILTNGASPAQDIAHVAKILPPAPVKAGIIEDLQARVARLEAFVLSQSAVQAAPQDSVVSLLSSSDRKQQVGKCEHFIRSSALTDYHSLTQHEHFYRN
jgi:hypothetical protein